MITVAEADRVIEDNLKKYPSVDCLLKNAYGKILKEEVRADRDYPPFTKSLMDGIAIKAEDYTSGLRKFEIAATIAAGKPAEFNKKAAACVEVMTGAVVPKVFDTIIPVEQITVKEGVAHINDGLKIDAMRYIRRKGADTKKGVILVPSGSLLNSVNLSTVASVGRTSVKVAYAPKAAVISTGDEIVPVDAPVVENYQTRQSNSVFIESALKYTNLFEVSSFHLKDNKKMLLKQISALLERFDVLIFSGGVSAGKFDFIPDVLKEVGIQVLFHNVRQKPGKPLLFGKNKKGQVVFGLPGNPISTQVGTMRYVLKHLKIALGLKEEDCYARLNHDYKVKTDFTLFLPVKLKITRDARWQAQAVEFSGSGDFAATVKSDGFMEIAEGNRDIKEGFWGKIYRWD